jgi:hypothetical protein
MLDPAHLLDGLFTPKTRSGEALFDVKGLHKKKPIEFSGLQMSATHQSILLAIIARIARQPKEKHLTESEEDSNIKTELFSLLAPSGEASRFSFSVLECSPYALLSDAGMGKGGKDYQLLIKLLSEMSDVSMHRGEGPKSSSSKLIAFKEVVNKKLAIGINWRLTDSVSGKQNVNISLAERRSLGNDPIAKILHTWLCRTIRKNGELMAGRGAEIDTLMRHIWGNRPCSADVIKKRRQATKRAVNEINNLPGWEATIEDTHVFVSRPASTFNHKVSVCSVKQDYRRTMADKISR